MKRSQFIVKKKKINTVCVVVLLLSVIFLMTSCPNGVDVDKNNEQEQEKQKPEEQKKVLTFSAVGIDGADISGIKLYVDGNERSNPYQIPLESGIQGNSISFKIAIPEKSGLLVDKWEGDVNISVSADKLTATSTINDISKDVSVKVFFRKMTIEDIAKLTKEKLYVDDPKNLGDLGNRAIGLAYTKNATNEDGLYLFGNKYVNGAWDKEPSVLFTFEEIAETSKEFGTIPPKSEWPKFDPKFSIGEALDLKWQNFKKSTSASFFSVGGLPWITFTTIITDPKFRKVCRPNQGVLYIVLKDVNTDPKVYFRAAAFMSLFICFDVTFVDKSDTDVIYSFPFGPYVVAQKYGNFPFPPADSNGDFDYENTKFHMFKLSDLVRVSLEKQLKDNNIDPAEAIKYVDTNFNGNGLDLGNLSKWDVYVSFINALPLYGIFETISFRNSLKLNDSEFWRKCWE